LIILDTNVVSEFVRPDPEPIVLRWANDQPAESIYITAITAAELLYGVARLPVGRKRDALSISVETLLTEKFQQRVLPFDLKASRAHGSLLANDERRGRPLPILDAQIASVCLARRSPLATRNIKDFNDTGIELINPWDE
jgi:predicted nucleic acid-binding protein